MRSLRRSLVVALLALPHAGCLVEETSATAEFTVWCRVLDGAGTPVNGQLVGFESAKYAYDGALDDSSLVTLGETTSSLAPGHLGSASFVVTYTLHARGDEHEVADFACMTTPPGGGSDVHAGFEVDYENVVTHVAIERELILRLPR